MPRIDETRPFIPVRIAVLTVSDTRERAGDKSGDTLVSLITEAACRVAWAASVAVGVAETTLSSVCALLAFLT